MVNPAQLANITYDAFSKGTEVDTQPMIDGAVEKRDFERAEYKSIQDVGAELDADFYGKWSGNLEELYDKAAQGELKIGSPEWSLATDKLKARAAQIKQVQDLRNEQIKMFTEKPDQVQFLEETEEGLVDTGLAGYRSRLEDLLGNEYADPTQLANDFSKLSGRIQVMPTGISAGFKEARVATEKVGQTLLNAGDRNIRDQKINAGSYTFNVRTTMNTDDTDRMVKGLISQFEPTLKADYKRKKANGQIPDGMDENKYVQSTIESMLPSGETETTTRAIPKASSSDDGSFKSMGDGRFVSNEYMFEAISKPSRTPKAGTKGSVFDESSGQITVTYMGKGETIKTFVNEDGDDVLGKLASIKVSPNGSIQGVIISGSDEQIIDFDKNAAKIEEFYGISKQQILDAVKGDTGAKVGAKGASQAGLGSKYNIK